MKAKKWAERLNKRPKTASLFDQDGEQVEPVRGKRDVDYHCEADEADDWMIPVDDCDVSY